MMARMKLKNYLSEAGFKSIADAARSARFEHETFRKWVNEERIPRPDNMRVIEVWSGGKVTPRDWYSTSAAA